tara:strand:+ start:88 stop:558 length:471 start_codon:yes stop_codon:yes gene_type:complete
MFSIWLKSSTNELDKVKNLMSSLSKSENKDYFDPHVTLITNLKTEEIARKKFNNVIKKKFKIEFNYINEGSTYFQRLYLTSEDNTNFFNSVANIEGWPSLWTPHLSLYYGNELPNSYPSKDFDNLIPINITFDTLELYRTGPIVSEWREITTLFLD